MKKIVLFVLALWCWQVWAWGAAPQVIPALQNWKDYKGTLTLASDGRVVVDSSADKELMGMAETLVQDLQDMFGWNYQVVTDCKPRKNDIFLSVKDLKKVAGNAEAYEMDIRSFVSISGQTPQGTFWGTRTLLQMLYVQKGALQKGKALDYPQYAHRGFMIDVARKFFTLDYLKQYVKILSFYKMNEFQIHLNDNGFVEFFDQDWNKTYAAFRLECESFPGLTAKDGSYSKKEFREFQLMARKYGVEVIPEIDAPAHSLAFTHYNPRLAADKKEYGMDHLDLYKKEVYEFLDTLYAEYIAGEEPVFVGPYVHIGTDEYNLKEVEQFRYFTNYYLDYIKKLGKQPRIWGSLKWMQGKTPTDLKGTVVNAWNYDWMDVNTAIKEGARAINTCDELLYIVPAVNYYHDFLDKKWLYENWTPEVMDRGDKTEVGNPGLMGAMFAVWNDRVGNGISQYDVHYRTYPAVQVVSEKLWKGANAEHVKFEQFEAACQIMPEAPGVNMLARVDGKKWLTPENKVIVLNGTDTVRTDIAEIGYPYAVEFEIAPDKDPVVGGILFKGPHSEFIANWHNTGKFAFRRDGYEFVFHAYKLPVDTWTKVRVEGDYKGTSLYINGKLVERLEGRKREVYNYTRKKRDFLWYQETLLFPLQELGDLMFGFKGQVKNVVCTPMKQK